MKCVENATVSLTVEISRETDKVKWTKDGIDVSETYNIGYDGVVHTLKIPNVSFEDAGEFTFTVGEEKTSAYVIVEGVCLALGLLKSWFISEKFLVLAHYLQTPILYSCEQRGWLGLM